MNGNIPEHISAATRKVKHLVPLNDFGVSRITAAGEPFRWATRLSDYGYLLISGSGCVIEFEYRLAKDFANQKIFS